MDDDIIESGIVIARKEFSIDLVRMLDNDIIKEIIAWIREDSALFVLMMEEELKMKESTEEVFTPGKFIPDEFVNANPDEYLE